jgi:hypothetical protein
MESVVQQGCCTSHLSKRDCSTKEEEKKKKKKKKKKLYL